MLTAPRAETLAAALDLDLDAAGVCHACLLFVSFALERGDEREIARAVRRLTPDLWEDGLALPARAALERARRRGVPDAEAAIADMDVRGARSPAVRAIVRRLGADLLARMEASAATARVATVTQLRSPRPPPAG